MTYKTVLLIFLALPFVCSSEETDSTEIIAFEYFTPANILKFADHLYETGDYLRAAGEYKRYLLFAPEMGGTDLIYYRMSRAVFLGGDYPGCLRLLDSFGKKYAGSPLAGDIPLYKAIIAYRQREYGQALAMAQAPGISNSDVQATVIAMSYLHLHNYDEARKSVCVSASESTATLLCNKLKATNNLRFKSKSQAAALSAVIPGSGKIYSGRVADGLYSLLLVGLTAWQSYDGFEDDGASSAKGWIFGVLGATFYLGNIYGSAVAAEMYNRKIHDEFLQGLQIEITLP